MEVSGKLTIGFSPELNKSGQRPLVIEFVGSGGIQLSIMGVRFSNGTVLDSMAVLSGGRPAYHTRFSPELQALIRDGGKSERKALRHATHE